MPTGDQSEFDDPLAWDDDGLPRSRLYGDVYFSAQDGLAESRAVFLEGCGLPGAWREHRRFVVGELGFGTGLNILALLDLWRRTRPPDGVLNIVSIEAHPISPQAAARALAHWPELADLASVLLAQWPGRAAGGHRCEFPEIGAILDVVVGEVGSALAGWMGRADAWFLDGFAPALNPDMWRDDVLALVAARSAPGARAATFTVAGQVRRGLTAAGFQVDKRPGFGRKRERLEARLPQAPVRTPQAPRRVAIVGAGIAGAAAARAVRALGGEATVIEAIAIGAGGSGNPAAMVTPRLDAGLGPAAQLFARAFARAVALYEREPGVVLSRGVLQLSAQERDPERFAKIAGSALFEPGALAMVSSTEVADRIGEAAAPMGLDQRSALVISPQALLHRWTGPTLDAEIVQLAGVGDRWSVIDAEGAVVLEADAVIVASGPASARLCPSIALQPVRGQVSWTHGPDTVGQALAWGGYVAPLGSGLLFGATHDRDDVGLDVRPSDNARNLATLGSALPEHASRLNGVALEARASIRAATADRLPLGGIAPGVARGVFLLTGFGSRGFSLAPLLAEHVAALAMDSPSPLPQSLADLVCPGRFARRALRRSS